MNDFSSPAAHAAFVKGKEDAWKRKPRQDRSGYPPDVRDAYLAGYQDGLEERQRVEQFRRTHGPRPR